MSPMTNKANDETDEGFVSPSVQRIVVKNRKDSSNQKRQSESESSNTASDNDSQTDSSYEENDRPTPTTNKTTKSSENESANKISGGATNTLKDAAESKAESLAKFVVYALLGKTNGNTEDKVERTVIRCVRMMMQKHEILFKGMMKRLQITSETGYVSFVSVANTLFEDEKMVVTWSRIVALYAFSGQLALYCKEKNLEEKINVAEFMGKYSKEVLTPYVINMGGWGKICEEFPEESDIENKIRRVLSWTAVGLGVAATVSYLTSR